MTAAAYLPHLLFRVISSGGRHDEMQARERSVIQTSTSLRNGAGTAVGHPDW
jgi:hypothetical protein